MTGMESKKHIDVIVKYFIPVTAGIETNVLETYSVLAEKGWDIAIHTSKDTALEKDILSDSEEIRGLKIKRYHFGPFGFKPKIDWRNTDMVCLHNFDMFPHFQILIKSIYLKLIGKKNFALIITPHGGFNPEWSVFPLVQRIIKFAYNYSLGALLINLAADGVRAVSEWEKEEMTRHGLSKNLITVISNGVGDEAFVDIENLAGQKIKNEVESFGRYIIQIGRIYPIKNYETAIRALRYLPSDINYIIAGPVSDKKYHEYLINLSKELGLQNRVHFVGVIRGVDKYYLIKNARAMVHMALWESFCNVLHEALSQGVVCVAADNTAIPYIVKDKVNGFLVPTKNYRALADKLNYVINNYDSPEMQKIRGDNLIVGRKWSWRNVAEKMDEFYDSKIFKYHEQPGENMVGKIVLRKIPCIFVSPHLDDAILSAGGLISYLADKTEVKVINIFTKASKPPYTISTKRFLSQCGYDDADLLFKDRAAEDGGLLSSLNIKPVNLGFIDAPFRKYDNPNFLRKLSARLLPEFIHIYPIHRLNIASNKISSADNAMIDEIKNKLRQITSGLKDFYIFCPFATDTHIDHVIARKACSEEFKKVVFWSDYPYYKNKNKLKIDFEFNQNDAVKEKLIRGYKSQIKILFKNNQIELSPEYYQVLK